MSAPKPARPRIVYLGNLPEVARSLASLESVELVACLVEEGDEEVREIESDLSGRDVSVHRVRDDSDVRRALQGYGELAQAVMANFGIILRKPTLRIPMDGFVNVHFGLLPAYPGRNPLLSALADGERVLGLTLHRVTERVDDGPILGMRTLAVGDAPVPHDVFMEMRGLATVMLNEHLSALKSPPVGFSR